MQEIESPIEKLFNNDNPIFSKEYKNHSFPVKKKLSNLSAAEMYRRRLNRMSSKKSMPTLDYSGFKLAKNISVQQIKEIIKEENKERQKKKIIHEIIDFSMIFVFVTVISLQYSLFNLINILFCMLFLYSLTSLSVGLRFKKFLFILFILLNSLECFTRLILIILSNMMDTKQHPLLNNLSFILIQKNDLLSNLLNFFLSLLLCVILILYLIFDKEYINNEFLSEYTGNELKQKANLLSKVLKSKYFFNGHLLLEWLVLLFICCDCYYSSSILEIISFISVFIYFTFFIIFKVSVVFKLKFFKFILFLYCFNIFVYYLFSTEIVLCLYQSGTVSNCTLDPSNNKLLSLFFGINQNINFPYLRNFKLSTSIQFWVKMICCGLIYFLKSAYNYLYLLYLNKQHQHLITDTTNEYTVLLKEIPHINTIFTHYKYKSWNFVSKIQQNLLNNNHLNLTIKRLLLILHSILFHELFSIYTLIISFAYITKIFKSTIRKDIPVLTYFIIQLNILQNYLILLNIFEAEPVSLWKFGYKYVLLFVTINQIKINQNIEENDKLLKTKEIDPLNQNYNSNESDNAKQYNVMTDESSSTPYEVQLTTQQEVKSDLKREYNKFYLNLFDKANEADYINFQAAFIYSSSGVNQDITLTQFITSKVLTNIQFITIICLAILSVSSYSVFNLLIMLCFISKLLFSQSSLKFNRILIILLEISLLTFYIFSIIYNLYLDITLSIWKYFSLVFNINILKNSMGIFLHWMLINLLLIEQYILNDEFIRDKYFSFSKYLSNKIAFLSTYIEINDNQQENKGFFYYLRKIITKTKLFAISIMLEIDSLVRLCYFWILIIVFVSILHSQTESIFNLVKLILILYLTNIILLDFNIKISNKNKNTLILMSYLLIIFSIITMIVKFLFCISTNIVKPIHITNHLLINSNVYMGVLNYTNLNFLGLKIFSNSHFLKDTILVILSFKIHKEINFLTNDMAFKEQKEDIKSKSFLKKLVQKLILKDIYNQYFILIQWIFLFICILVKKNIILLIGLLFLSYYFIKTVKCYYNIFNIDIDESFRSNLKSYSNEKFLRKEKLRKIKNNVFYFMKSYYIVSVIIFYVLTIIYRQNIEGFHINYTKYSNIKEALVSLCIYFGLSYSITNNTDLVIYNSFYIFYLILTSLAIYKYTESIDIYNEMMIKNVSICKKPNLNIRKLRSEEKRTKDLDLQSQKSKEFVDLEVNRDSILSNMKDKVSFKTNKKLSFYNFFESNEKDNIVNMLIDNNSTNLFDTKIQKYSLELQIWMKKFCEEIIIIFVFLSSLLKLNLISFVMLIFCLMFVFLGKNIKKMLYLTFFYFTIIWIQILMSSVFFTPLDYLGISNETAIFFGLKETSAQYLALIVDFIILILVFIYFEIFCFKIYENYQVKKNRLDTFQNNFYSYYLNENSMVTDDEYQNFRFFMKESYDLELQDSHNNYRANTEVTKRGILHLNSEEVRDFNDDISMNDEYIKLVPDHIKSKYNITKVQKYLKIKKQVYLILQNLALILILSFTLFNDGLISIPYLFFTLIFLYKLHNFREGKIWKFQKYSKYLLKPYLILDITLYFIYLIPVNLIDFTPFLKIIGIKRINNSNGDLFYEPLLLWLLKILSFFLLSIQEVIYSSSDFKYFLLKYFVKSKNRKILNSRLFTFTFNNSRIAQMEKITQKINNIDQTLSDIKTQLKQWNEKMNHKDISVSEEQERVEVSKEIIRKKYLNKKVNYRKSKKAGSKILSTRKFATGNILNRSLDSIVVRNKGQLSDSVNKMIKIISDYWLIELNVFLAKSISLIANSSQNKTNLLQGEDNIASNLDIKILNFIVDNEQMLIELVNQSFIENKEKNNNKVNQKPLYESISDSNSLIDEADEYGELLVTVENDSKSNIKNKLFVFSTDGFFYDIAKDILVDQFLKSYSRLDIIKDSLRIIKKLISNHITYVVFIMIIINTLIKANWYYCIIPVFIFIYGIPNFPRPRKIFWKLLIIYIMTFIVLKFIIQMRIVRSNLPGKPFLEDDIITNSYLNDLFFYGKDYEVDINVNDNPRFFNYDINFQTTEFIVVDEYYIVKDINNQFSSKTDNIETEDILMKDIGFGLIVFKSSLSINFFNYIIFDVLILFVLLINQFKLISMGLWRVLESDIETIYEAYDRIYNFRSLQNQMTEINIDTLKLRRHKTSFEKAIKPEDINKLKEMAEKEAFVDEKHNISSNIKKNHQSKFKYLLQSFFPTLKNEKPGINLYIYYNIVLMLIIIYAVIFYTSLDKDSSLANSSEYINMNMFSGKMVIFVLVHVVIIILERYIFLTNNNITSDLEYKFYDKQTGKEADFSFNIKQKYLTEARNNSFYMIYEFEKDTEESEEINEYPIMSKMSSYEPELNKIIKKFRKSYSYNNNDNNRSSILKKSDSNKITNSRFKSLVMNKNSNILEDYQEMKGIKYSAKRSQFILENIPEREDSLKESIKENNRLSYNEVRSENSTNSNKTELLNKDEYMFEDNSNDEMEERLEVEEQNFVSKKSMIELVKTINTKKYDIVTFHFDSKNFALKFKFFLLLISVILSHLFVFLYIPMIGNFNISNTYICSTNEKNCNSFTNNTYLQILYIMYCIYFILSGVQIKFGFLELNENSNTIKEYSLFRLYCFKIYKAIPFIYELKHTIDWTFTNTSLDLIKWYRLENVSDYLFETKCRNNMNKQKIIGERDSFIVRLFSGWCTFIFIILVVFIPLFLFSNLNPTMQANGIEDFNLSFSIEVTTNLNSTSSSNNEVNKKSYDLFQISNVIIQQLTLDQFNSLGFDKNIYTKNIDISTAQKITASTNSLNNWLMSESAIYEISEALTDKKSTVYLKLNISILKKKENSSKSLSSYNRFEVELMEQDRNDLLNQFFNYKCTLTANNYELSKIIDNFYTPFFKYEDNGSGIIEIEPNLKEKVKLILNCNQGKMYWSVVKMKDLVNNSTDSLEEEITFVVFNELYSLTTNSYNIITFYVTFVLLFGKLLRSGFESPFQDIILLEMPNPDKLIQVYKGIKLARYKNELYKEEELYYLLMDLLRSPEILRIITKSSINDFSERQEYL